MKKVLFILLSFLFVSNLFSQTNIEKKWNDEWKRTHPTNTTILNDKVVINKISLKDSLNNIYGNMQNMNQYLKSLNDIRYESGNYLIKARNQILSGIGIQIFAGLFYSISISNINNKISQFDHPTMNPDKQEIEKLIRTQHNINTCSLISGIIGLGFEISGINNIGKAGISLNGNGVGIKINF